MNPHRHYAFFPLMCVYVCQLGDGGVEPVSGDLRRGSSGEESGVYVSRLGRIATG